MAPKMLVPGWQSDEIFMIPLGTYYIQFLTDNFFLYYEVMTFLPFDVLHADFECNHGSGVEFLDLAKLKGR